MNIQCFLHTRFSYTLFNKTLGGVSVLKHSAEPYKRSTELRQAFEGLRENRKLGRVFEKLGRVFLLQHDPCCPNQPR